LESKKYYSVIVATIPYTCNEIERENNSNEKNILLKSDFGTKMENSIIVMYISPIIRSSDPSNKKRSIMEIGIFITIFDILFLSVGNRLWSLMIIFAMFHEERISIIVEAMVKNRDNISSIVQ